MLLLIAQNKLFNLEGDVIMNFVTFLKMFTRRIIVQNRVEDVQLGVKSYKIKLNLTKQKTWPGLIQKAKDGGLDVIETYVFWNFHEPDDISHLVGAFPYRPVEDLAFVVARFCQRGGTCQNYYVHGGTNFGRTTGGPFISTSYDFDAPLDEYVQTLQDYFSNDTFRCRSLMSCAMAVVYKTSSTCVAFLANIDKQHDAIASYNGRSYHLPAWSVSILPDCKHVVYNTAKVNYMATVQRFVPASVGDEFSVSKAISLNWSYIHEPIGISSNDAFNRRGLLESIRSKQSIRAMKNVESYKVLVASLDMRQLIHVMLYVQNPANRPTYPDSITDEERFMFRKFGLRMKLSCSLVKVAKRAGTVTGQNGHKPKRARA
ncbi:beta-galactosidase 8 [Tanacetum coccineum]|uniref:beta-galactosidase n=1 Tax=Tanacetum coccineum TaxID=301880 RepID=A0ABQ5F2A5_9ASTR